VSVALEEKAETDWERPDRYHRELESTRLWDTLGVQGIDGTFR
jgi:hypothetical protein